MYSKHWYLSKIFWLAVASAAGYVINKYILPAGYVLDGELIQLIDALAFVVIAIWRLFFTKKALVR